MKALLAALVGCGLVAAAPPVRAIYPDSANGTAVAVPAGYGLSTTSSMIDCTSSVRFSYEHPLGGNSTDCGCGVKTTTVFLTPVEGNASDILNTPTETIYYTVTTGITSLSDDVNPSTGTEVGHSVPYTVDSVFSSTATYTTTYPTSGTGSSDSEDVTLTVTNRRTLTRTRQVVSVSASASSATSSSASRTETVIVTKTSQVLVTVHRTISSPGATGVDASEIFSTQNAPSSAPMDSSDATSSASVETAAPIATSVQTAAGTMQISGTSSTVVPFSNTAAAPSTSEQEIVTVDITSLHTVTRTKGTGSGTVSAILTASSGGQGPAPITLSEEGSATFANFSPNETPPRSLPVAVSDTSVVFGTGSLSPQASGKPTDNIASPVATSLMVSMSIAPVDSTSLRFSSGGPGNLTLAGPTVTSASAGSSTKPKISSLTSTNNGATPSTTPAKTGSDISIYLPTPPQPSTAASDSSLIAGAAGTTSLAFPPVPASSSLEVTAIPNSALPTATGTSLETSVGSVSSASALSSTSEHPASSVSSAGFPTSSTAVSWVTSTFGGDGTTRGFPVSSSSTVSSTIQVSLKVANSSAPVSTTAAPVIPAAGYGAPLSLSAPFSTSSSATGVSQSVTSSESATIAASSTPSSTATPVSNATVTIQPTADCGELGNFTINWDDEPIYVQDNMTDPSSVPVFNPYHHLFFANGFSYFDPNSTITLPATYDPISGPNLAIFTIPGDEQVGDDNEIDEYGMLPGTIGAGPRVADTAYWFDAYSAELGCDNGGAEPCNMTISGYKYAGIFDNQTKVIEQSALIASCTALEDCSLQHVELVGFEAMSSIRFEAVVDGNLLRSWAIDNLSLGWWDNSCTAGHRRVSSKK